MGLRSVSIAPAPWFRYGESEVSLYRCSTLDQLRVYILATFTVYSSGTAFSLYLLYVHEALIAATLVPILTVMIGSVVANSRMRRIVSPVKTIWAFRHLITRHSTIVTGSWLVLCVPYFEASRTIFFMQRSTSSTLTLLDLYGFVTLGFGLLLTYALATDILIAVRFYRNAVDTNGQ